MARTVATRGLILLLAAGVLTGCSTWQWRGPGGAQSAESSNKQSQTEVSRKVADMLKFASETLSLPARARANVLQRTRAQYQAKPTAPNRLRVALLAVLLPDTAGDTHQLRKWLANYDWQAAPASYRALAHITQTLLDLRQTRAAVNADKTDKLKSKLAAARAALTNKTEQNKQLRAQLDALKKIEKNLSQRATSTNDAS